jgi:hypothetical protein
MIEIMTTILQILNALGSLGTLGMFIMLFIKDKDKQKQIIKLTSIASALENQSEYLNKQNELLAQQVDIFRNTSLLKGHDAEALQKLHDIEEKKLKLSVKPNLWMNGGIERGYHGDVQLNLNNKGEIATVLNCEILIGDIALINNSFPFELEKGQNRYISAKTTGKPIRDCEYDIKITYSDSLGNKYNSLLRGKGASSKIIETKEE